MTIHIIEHHNPFNPQDSQTHDVAAGVSVFSWLRQRYSGFKEFSYPTVCLLNGKPLLRKDWKRTLVDGDVVNFVSAPTGDPISILITVLVSAGANYVLSSQLAKKPKIPGDIPDADPVYSLRGQRNQIRLGQPIEAPYGRVRVWPSYAAASYNKYIGNDQYLYQLFCLGQGSYDVHQLYIEDTPIESFQDVEYEVVAPNQRVTLLNDTVLTSSEVSNIELFGPNQSEYTGHSGPFVVNDAQADVVYLEVDITFPQGLYYAADNGGLTNRTIHVGFEYRPIDAQGNALGGWQELRDFQRIMATTTPQRFTLGRRVPAGRYEVRGVRLNDKVEGHRSGDTVIWESLRAYVPSQRVYGDVTMLAVKARASNNLNDRSSNRINVDVTRRIPTWSPEGGWTERLPTRSPVWAFCDVFRAEYGGRLGADYLDLDALYALDQELSTRGDTFDWVFDQRTTVWDAAKTIARVARAAPLLNGSRITMVRDAPRSLPVAVFNQNNIVEGSFRWDIKLFEVGEHDSVAVEYIDPTTWKQEEVVCVLPGGTSNYPEKLRLPGCTSRANAYHEGLFIAANNQYARETISFQTGLEGYIPAFGDLISVSHDVPRWGQAGQVRSINGLRIELSEPVEFGSGQHYIVLRKKDGSAAGPYAVNATEYTDVVELESAIDDLFYFGGQYELPLYQFGVGNQWAKLCKVTDIRPSGGEAVEIVCVNYDERVHSFDDAVVPPMGQNAAPISVPALPVVTGLQVDPVRDTDQFVLVSWSPALGARRYVLEQSSNGSDWSLVAELSATHYNLPVTVGALYVRVSAINLGQGAWAVWHGQVGVPVNPPVNVTGLVIQQAFTGSFVKVQWNGVSDADSYMVRVCQDAGATLMRTVEVTGLSYTYSFENAMEDGSVSRYLQFQIVAKNAAGESDTPAVLDVFNPVPSVLGGIQSVVKSDTATEAVFTLSWAASSDVDVKGYRVWGSETSGFTADAATLLHDVAGTSVDIVLAKVDHDTNAGTPDQTPTYYWRVAAYDLWGDEVNLSPEQTIVGV